LLDDETEALRALLQARSLHGGTILSEIVLTTRELLARTMDLGTLPPGRLALLLASSAPEPVAARALDLLSERLGGGRPRLPAAACRDFYRPDALFESAEPQAQAVRLADGWPAHERSLRGSLDEQAALLRAQSGPYLVCGVYLHGAALRSSHPAELPANPEPGEPTDAQAALWQPLQAAYLADLDPPEGAHA
jgi:hypothetical protein